MGNTETAFSYAIAADTDLQYVPFAGPKVDGEGTDEFGQIAVAREQSYNGNMHIAGFWKVQPSTSPLYAPVGDESGYVIEGSATIEFLETGEKVELKAGDLYTFAKGTLQRWTVHEPFKKFVVVADGPAAG